MPVYLSLDLPPQGPPSAPQQAQAEYLRQIGNGYHRVAEFVAILEQDGWQVDSHLSFAFARHPNVRTRVQARQRLTTLGIDPSAVRIEATPSERTIRLRQLRNQRRDAKRR